MPLIASDHKGDFEKCPTGMVGAVCSHVIDLGLQKDNFGERQEVALCFELAHRMQDGRPFMVSRRYRLSLNEKANLRKDLESWRGKPFTEQELEGFDVEKLLNANCALNIIHKDNGYADFAAIVPPMPGSEKLQKTGQPAPQWLQTLAAKGHLTDEDRATTAANEAAAGGEVGAEGNPLPF